MRGAADCCGDEARGRGGEAGGLASRVVRQLGAMVHRTPRRGLGDFTLPAGSGLKTGLATIFWAAAYERLRNSGLAPGRSAKKLSDAACAALLRASRPAAPSSLAAGRSLDWRAGVECSRSSINQRASMAAVFSSSQESSSWAISLRRLAAWLRRESS